MKIFKHEKISWSMIAIDVALLCPALNRGDLYQFTNRLFQYNAGLRGVKEGIYPRFSQAPETLCLPHLTLAQGFIDETDQEAVASTLEAALKEQKPILWTTNGIKTKQLPNGYTGVELDILKTEELVKIHRKVMEVLEPFVQYDCDDAAAFYGAIDFISKTWVQKYREGAFERFQPHITLGIGDSVKSESSALDFRRQEFICVSKGVLAQLGNYCTIQKVMRTYTLGSQKK